MPASPGRRPHPSHGSKRNVLGVLVDDADYGEVVERVLAAARAGRPLGVSALAVHGVMEGVLDAEQRHRLNALDVVTADGQPVRWALRLLHRSRLRERVYGPHLMLHLCARAAQEGLPIYLYGSRSEVLEPLAANLRARFPRLVVAGMQPSRFRPLEPGEPERIAADVRASGARLVFVGLGCPRQEIFAFEQRERIGVPLLAVGAAFDYHAGLLAEPPRWVQDAGLQWAHRLVREPRRLWRRYALLNPAYLGLLAAQRAGAWHPDPAAPAPQQELLPG